MTTFNECLNINPCVAILRGLDIASACEVGELIYQSGIRSIEVPLNRPNAIECITELVAFLPQDCFIGAGTVITAEQVKKVSSIGGRFIVSPNTSIPVIEQAMNFNLLPIPGVATVTEAYAAYQAGARYLKLFPASTYGVRHLQVLTSVLPNDVKIIPVGGVSVDNMLQWLIGGAAGVGIGNDLYECGNTTEQVKLKLAAISGALSNYNDRSRKVTK